MNTKNKKSKISRTSILIVFSCVLVAVNILALYIFEKEIKACGGYSFINPRFACGYKNVIDKKGYVELRTKLMGYIEDKKVERKADVVSIWFRDLEIGGPTFGINDRVDFIPASLLKLPLVLTFFQLAEHDPGLSEKTLVYGDNLTPVADQTFIPADRPEKGKQYTVDQLIRFSIIDSDNIAAQLLYEYLENSYPGELSNMYRDLGILEPGNDLNLAGVNTKGYGSIFRMVYNVSFLDKEMSEKLLSLLAQTNFHDGLRAGVPEDVVIAHKFGERFLSDGSKQLHDCGIIYYPDNPYQLCVMTSGNNFNDLSKIIKEISGEVYKEFDSRKISK